MSTSSVETQQPANQRRRGPHILSTVLFITAIAFAAVAGYLYWDEQQNDKNDPTPPPATSGEWGLAQIANQFEQAGMGTEYGRTNGHTDQITGVPGQAIKVNGTEVYIFIFSQSVEQKNPIAAAEAAYKKIDPATIKLTRQSTDAEIGEGEDLHVFQGSNIIAVMVGGSPEDVEKVQAVIEGLT